MNALERISNLSFPALRSLLRAINSCRTRLAGRLSFGITARLMIAFIGVGALLLAANFIVEQNVLIERTTQTIRIAPPVPYVPQPVVVVARVPVIQRRVVTS